MSSRAERIRREIVEARSPLAGHSMNQSRLKRMSEGDRKMGVPEITSETEAEAVLKHLKNNVFFRLFLEKAKVLDQKGATIQQRVGQLSLLISSQINNFMKTGPDVFLETFRAVLKNFSPSLIPSTYLSECFQLGFTNDNHKSL